MSIESEKDGRIDRRKALPISEVAEMLGVSPMTIRRAIDAGEIPFIQVRSKKQVPRAAVEELLTPKWGALPDNEVAI